MSTIIINPKPSQNIEGSGVIIEIPESNLTLDSLNGLYKTTVTHNLGNDKLIVSVKNSKDIIEVGLSDFTLNDFCLHTDIKENLIVKVLV